MKYERTSEDAGRAACGARVVARKGHLRRAADAIGKPINARVRFFYPTPQLVGGVTATDTPGAIRNSATREKVQDAIDGRGGPRFQLFAPPTVCLYVCTLVLRGNTLAGQVLLEGNSFASRRFVRWCYAVILCCSRETLLRARKSFLFVARKSFCDSRIT